MSRRWFALSDDGGGLGVFPLPNVPLVEPTAGGAQRSATQPTEIDQDTQVLVESGLRECRGKSLCFANVGGEQEGQLD